MNKFLAIIKREYVQRVRAKSFVIFTILGPLLMVVFTVVPGLIFAMKTGDATRLAVVDQSGKMYGRVRETIMKERSDDDEKKDSPAGAVNENSQKRVERTGRAMMGTYVIEQADLNGRPLDAVKQELDGRVRQNQLDGYIIIPPDVSGENKFEFHARNTSDVITRSQIKNSLNDAVRDQRLAEANISQDQMREINRDINLTLLKAGEGGGEVDSGGSFWLVFAIGFLIYIMLVSYGQVILAAVVEEKETRIAEVLFSSVSSFQLMLGKLIGVSLVALTQYAIWGLAAAAFGIYGIGMLASSGMNISLPHIPPSVFVYLFVFFLIGYFVYSTIYALVGAMVTTTQEGGQLALPVMFLLMIGFYLAFPVIRSPNSSFSFWVSMIPFFSPITMPVRIVTQSPPFWQIALSIMIGVATILFLVWLAARIYRIGMLMYGKRPTIPEIMRWIRQT